MIHDHLTFDNCDNSETMENGSSFRYRLTCQLGNYDSDLKHLKEFKFIVALNMKNKNNHSKYIRILMTMEMERNGKY